MRSVRQPRRFPRTGESVLDRAPRCAIATCAIAIAPGMALLSGILLVLLAFPVSATGQAVEVASQVRLVEFAAVPERPVMGEPFELHLTLRLQPGTVGIPERILPAALHAEGTAPGSFSENSAAGDSIDLVANFPMIAFRSGVVGLPDLPLRFLPVTGRDQGGWRWEEGEASAPARDAASDTAFVLLRLGAIQVVSVLPSDTEDPLIPRPAADVLGRDRSYQGLAGLVFVWLAGGLAAATLILVVAGRVRSRHETGRLEESARRKALAGLDRALADGWHREGRMSEFYRAITGNMRSFAASLDPGWGADLTMREVVAGVMLRWGPDRVDSLASTIARAERICFGNELPSLRTAEEDWQSIRDWVRDTPGAA